MSFISYEILPAFVLSFLTIVVVSLMTPHQVPHKVSADFKRLDAMNE
jgi:hypothetical protein